MILTSNDIFGDLFADLGITNPQFFTTLPKDTEWSPEYPSGKSVTQELVKLVPAIGHHFTRCPECLPGLAYGTATSVVAQVVIHLNDNHHWTREQIADWLETLPIDLTIKPTKKESTADADRDTAEQIQKVYESLGIAGLFDSCS